MGQADADLGELHHLVGQLSALPGVEAVTLGGSRATGTATAGSDWDFGLYYRGALAAADVEALGYPGVVTEVGGWGPVVNGGAWLRVDGRRVDLCYRDLNEVAFWTAEAEEGRFRIEALATYVAGIPTYVLRGELALNRVLSGTLPRPEFPPALAATAPPRWRGLARMGILTALAHCGRGDVVATVANLAQAALSEAEARMAERGEWVLNEKGLIDRTGLSAVHEVLASPGTSAAELSASVRRVGELTGAGSEAPW